MNFLKRLFGTAVRHIKGKRPMELERTFGNAVGLICTDAYDEDTPIQDLALKAATSGLGFGLLAGCEETNEKFELLVSYKNEYPDAQKMIRHMLEVIAIFCRPEMQASLFKASKNGDLDPHVYVAMLLIRSSGDAFGEVTEDRRRFYFSQIVVYSLLFGLLLCVEQIEIARKVADYVPERSETEPVEGDSQDDAGLRLLRLAEQALSIDEEWCVREPRKLTWWAHRLSQSIWADPVRRVQDADVSAVHGEIDLLYDVPDTVDTFVALQEINAEIPKNIVLFDPRDRRLFLHCALYVHDEIEESYGGLLMQALALQAADAHARIEDLAQRIGGKPAFSEHPDQGARTEPDQILRVREDVYWPAGSLRSPFSAKDFTVAGEFMPDPTLNFRTTETSMEMELPFGPSSEDGVAVLRANTQARSQELGSGCLMILNIPVKPDLGLALKLNFAEATTWTGCHMLGGWCAGIQGVAFVHFVPAFVYKKGLMSALVVNAAARARFSGVYLNSRTV